MDLPIGSIIMWYKALADIPSGWILCDGNDGSPDLRNRFVIGAASDTDRVPSGSTSHSHTNAQTVAGGAHAHDVTGSISGTVSKVDVSDVGSGTSGISKTHSHIVDFDLPSSGTHQHTTTNTNPANNDPPYLQVYFIMRKI